MSNMSSILSFKENFFKHLNFPLLIVYDVCMWACGESEDNCGIGFLRPRLCGIQSQTQVFRFVLAKHLTPEPSSCIPNNFFKGTKDRT